MDWLPAYMRPEIGEATHAALRSGYGIGLLLTVLFTARHARRYFTSERWGGYAESTPFVDAIQNPYVRPVLLAVWTLSAALLIVGRWTIPAALVNVLLCRHYFVDMRWNGVLRGMGAPGYMTYWIGAVVAVLELARAYAPAAVPLALLAAQIDYALIMLSAGVYKTFAGYRFNAGMQYGHANPQWGYWWGLWSRLSPQHALFRFMNHSVWIIQTSASVMMLIPATRQIGALLIIASFAFVATQIRLGALCFMVVVAALTYFPAGGLVDGFLANVIPAAAIVAPATTSTPIVSTLLTVAVVGYLLMLPVAFGTLFLNYYGRRSLPGRLQAAIEGYANFFGIILWRVFSVDHTNFYVLIHRQPREGGERTLVSRYDRVLSRYNDVGEAIAVTCVFTTLKYYPSDSDRFVDRILRYSRTIPRSDGEVLVFEYISLRDGEAEFLHLPVAEFVVDVEAGTVEEHVLDEEVSLRKPHEHSPVFEGTRPGSYVAKGA